mgnify:CR=1 FL=1
MLILIVKTEEVARELLPIFYRIQMKRVFVKIILE